MKLTIFLVVLSLAAMAVMVSQFVRQEMILNNLKVMAREKTADVIKKDRSIAQLKITLQDLKPKLMTVKTITGEMKTKKDALEKEIKELEANLKTCNNENGEAEKKKTEITGNLNKQKMEHEEAKQKAQKEIQDLKQQNLDREKAICALVDTTNAEARKLCGLNN